MAKHTPGPWRVAMIAKSERVLADAATPLGIQIIARLYRTNANREADATLIAAAPDLLEALKGIIAGFDARAEAIIAGRKGGLASQAARRARQEAGERS